MANKAGLKSQLISNMRGNLEPVTSLGDQATRQVFSTPFGSREVLNKCERSYLLSSPGQTAEARARSPDPVTSAHGHWNHLHGTHPDWGGGCTPCPFFTLLGVHTSGGGVEAEAEAGRKGQGRDACGCNRGEGPDRGRESQGQQVRAGGESE